jgi:NAD(P)H-hydrate epimerase
VIDAVFGYGLTRPIEGVYAEIIDSVNRLPNFKIAIDLPSGLMCDESTVIKKNSVLKANFTFTFQVYKKCLLVSENQDFIGEVELLDIGLKTDFLNSIKITSFVIDERFVGTSLPARNTNVSKFDFGHALLVAGSLGKMGAAVISSKACLRTGTGLLSVQIPECGIEIMQTSVPEAMVVKDEGKEYLSTVYIKGKYDAVGIGPGIARKEETARVLKSFLQNANVPMVVDADGLNILSDNKTWLAFANSPLILTPHAGEFERLFGKAESDFDRLQLACENAMKYNCYIVLKGKNTVVISPDRNMYFNVNGNAGLAKGGSGDALTGIVLALLAQGYSPLVASIGGVFLHGRAADITLEKQSKESMLITDVIENIGKAFDSIHQ